MIAHAGRTEGGPQDCVLAPRCIRRRGRAKPIELGAAELAPTDDLDAGASARRRAAVDRHRVFAGANQERALIRHSISRHRRCRRT
jgi:hypothetical protein